MSEECEHTCGAAGGCIICGENMLTVEIVQGLEEKLSELAPLSLSYKRVCEVLGIKKDVIGYVDELQTQLAALQWISVSERLPKEPKLFKYIDELRTYPVRLKERTIDKGWRKARYTGKGCWSIEGCHGDWTVIEWFDLPIPPLPKEQDNG